LLIVLRDPLEPHPHDPDVKALLHVAVVCSIPLACNRATADLVIPSPLRFKLAAGFSALQAGVRALSAAGPLRSSRPFPPSWSAPAEPS
jgi:hypothetical protein